MKKVLILCTGNSCRSILAEALVNDVYKDQIEASSAGVRASGRVNPNAQKLLEKEGIWQEKYHSKTIEELGDAKFDLVVTVCDNAKESCPIFGGGVEVYHMSFEDPDGKEYEAFEQCYSDIKEKLLPEIAKRVL